MYFDEVIANEWDLDEALEQLLQEHDRSTAINKLRLDLEEAINQRPNTTESSKKKAKRLLLNWNKKWPKKLRNSIKGKEKAEHQENNQEHTQSIEIYDNHGTINNSNISYNDVNKRKGVDESVVISQKKPKNHQEEVEIWQKWIEFIKDAQNKPETHEFACEKNGVIRLGLGITNTTMSDEDYNQLKTLVLEEIPNYIPDMIQDVCAYLDGIFETTDIKELEYNIKWPKTDSKEPAYLNRLDLIQSISLALFDFSYNEDNGIASLEQTYRDVFPYPFIKACVRFVGNAQLKFVPGEISLESMTQQLNHLKKTLAPNEKYYADGIVSYIANEICIYEASGPFGSKEKNKHNFDSHKAMYGLLSCLATIAESYSYASMAIFSKLKLYFVQTKGCSIQLWYVQHLQDNVYGMVRECKLSLTNSKYKYVDNVLECLQFAGVLQNRLTNTMSVIDELIADHNKTLITRKTQQHPSQPSPPKLLNKVIKPKILKLTESKHSKDMHRLGPDSFLEE